jgi:hypothetical protein
MSMIDHVSMAWPSFPAISAHVARRLRELGGIALVSLAMMAALALAWSVHDPSLSHATDACIICSPARCGAADLMMQLLGLGSLALLIRSAFGAIACLVIAAWPRLRVMRGFSARFALPRLYLRAFPAVCGPLP